MLRGAVELAQPERKQAEGIDHRRSRATAAHSTSRANRELCTICCGIGCRSPYGSLTAAR